MIMTRVMNIFQEEWRGRSTTSRKFACGDPPSQPSSGWVRLSYSASGGEKHLGCMKQMAQCSFAKKRNRRQCPVSRISRSFAIRRNPESMCASDFAREDEDLAMFLNNSPADPTV
jgi:hypothetical protein